MAKEELLEFEGVVTEVLPDGNYRVKLDNDHEVLAYMSGKMRKFRIRTGVGDKVVVEMSPYDLDRGRINFRHRDTNRPLFQKMVRAGEIESIRPNRVDRAACEDDADGRQCGHHDYSDMSSGCVRRSCAYRTSAAKR